MLALSTQMGWKIHQIDVKTTFLNGKIEEEVYIKQPEGFQAFDRDSHVCRLKRDLYGLKQAPRAWYTRIDSYFTRRFHMEKRKPMHTPLAGNWREEDATSVNQLSQAMVQPTKLFWKATKHVLRYLRGTSQFGLWYSPTEGVKLQGFTDADWAGSPSDQ
eukprot:PITA_20704